MERDVSAFTLNIPVATCTRWRSASGASAFLKGVQPYLIVKKDQAETAIYFQDVLKNRANGVDHLMERLANMRLKQQKVVDRSVGVTF